MSPELVGVIGVALLLALIFCKVWVGIAMALVGFLGYAYLEGWQKAFMMVGTEPYAQVASYVFTCVPLFILMGAVVANMGVAKDLYDAASKWLSAFKGGLGMATVVASGLFAAMTGSSMACAVSMGKIAIPEMKAKGYSPRLATGIVAAGGTLGILIPPSLGFVLYGLLTEQSIGKLFMAGIIPGILEVVFYCLTIFILCKFEPEMVPHSEQSSIKFTEKMRSLKNTWAMILIFLIVIGGIYMGVITATEAGAIGAFGAIFVSFLARRVNKQAFKNSILEAAEGTAMIVLMVVGVFIFMRFLTVSKLPTTLSTIIAKLNLPKYGVLIAILVFYIILGCFMDIFAIILLTVPIFYPVILSLGFDPIWFGVLMVRVMEVGLITPPIGLNVFVLRSVTDVPMKEIFKGVFPFLIADFCHITVLILFPSLALFIPNRMM
ncbi:MAG: TRAP transporter large permease [Candidatus Bathyarchaeia archaeon]